MGFRILVALRRADRPLTLRELQSVVPDATSFDVDALVTTGPLAIVKRLRRSARGFETAIGFPDKFTPHPTNCPGTRILDVGDEDDRNTKTRTMATTTQMETRDEQIVELLAAGRTVTEAASALGVSSQTVYRRLASRPKLRGRINDRKAEHWRPLATELRDGGLAAARRLRYLSESAQHESTQARCCVALIELATKLHELTEILPRLATLETQAAELESSRGQ